MTKASGISEERRKLIDAMALSIKRVRSSGCNANSRKKPEIPKKKSDGKAFSVSEKTAPVTGTANIAPTIKPIFNKERMDRFRHLLEEQRDELLGDMRKKSCLRKEEVQIADGNGKHASGNHIGENHSSDPSATEKQILNRKKRLEKIKEALARINDGTYGICQNEDCGRPIGIKRLRLTPIADLCVPCKEIKKQKEKRLNGGRYHRPYTIDESVGAPI